MAGLPKRYPKRYPENIKGTTNASATPLNVFIPFKIYETKSNADLCLIFDRKHANLDLKTTLVPCPIVGYGWPPKKEPKKHQGYHQCQCSTSKGFHTS